MIWRNMFNCATEFQKNICLWQYYGFIDANTIAGMIKETNCLVITNSVDTDKTSGIFCCNYIADDSNNYQC